MNEQLKQRIDKVLTRTKAIGADALVLGGGADLAFLTGYEAMPLERLTALVCRSEPKARNPVLLVPELEIPRVSQCPDLFEIEGWGETADPVARIVQHLPENGTVLISDDFWASHLLRLQSQAPDLSFRSISERLGGLRSIKSPPERASLRKVGSLADQVASQLQRGDIRLVGRTEAQVASDIATRLLEAGHETVEFVIVASGPNSASPHHHPGDRVIGECEMVLCDFGGKLQGYCSDTTRCVYTGLIPDDVSAAYQALQEGQELAFKSAMPGNLLSDVDGAARSILSDAGYGAFFIHRTGHGIGTEVHEHPYVTEQNNLPIEIGHAFSIEPGIYMPGKWGMRLEDIVVVEEDGPRRCNNSDHRLLVVDG